MPHKERCSSFLVFVPVWFSAAWLKVKSGDYTIYVHIIEARDLQAEDLQVFHAAASPRARDREKALVCGGGGRSKGLEICRVMSWGLRKYYLA